MSNRETRFGLIIPGGNIVIEPELNRIPLQNVNFYASRLWLQEMTPENLGNMGNEVEEAARRLKRTRPDAVAYACTSGSLIKGLDWEINLRKRLEDIMGCEAITASLAMIKGLKTLGIKKVGVATPYIDRVNELVKEFLQKYGFEVPIIKGLQLSTAFGCTAEDAYKIAKEVALPEVDGIFISCTNFKGLQVIERLERETGKQVASSNQCILWLLLQITGYSTPVEGFGRLLKLFG